MKNVKLLSLEPLIAGQIAQAVSAYAHAAYPPGGSECAQASHQALMDIARGIHVEATGRGYALKKRQLPMLRTAIEWFYSEDNTAEANTGVNAAELISRLTP